MPIPFMTSQRAVSPNRIELLQCTFLKVAQAIDIKSSVSPFSGEVTDRIQTKNTGEIKFSIKGL